MRKRVKMLFAAALCAATMAIVGCGGGNANQAAPAEAVQEADPTQKFLGDWKLAYIESPGMTIMGDLNGLTELSGQDMNIEMNIKDDGTATFSMGTVSTDMSWELVTDNVIKLTATNAAADGDSETTDESVPESVNVTYANDELRFSLEPTGATESEEEGVAEAMSSGSMVLTHDGTSPNLSIPSVDDAKPITAAEDLVGEWKLSGMGIFGMVMVGDSDGVDDIFGAESANVTFNEDGTCDFMGNEAAYEVTDKGVTLTDSSAGSKVSYPVVALGDSIIIDLSASLGVVSGSDSSLFLMYSR